VRSGIQFSAISRSRNQHRPQLMIQCVRHGQSARSAVSVASLCSPQAGCQNGTAALLREKFVLFLVLMFLSAVITAATRDIRWFLYGAWISLSIALWIALASRHYRKFLTIVGSIIFFTGATVLYRSLNQESILVRVFEAARKGTQAALNEFQNKPLPPPALKQPTPQYRDSGSMRSEKGRRISIKC